MLDPLQSIYTNDWSILLINHQIYKLIKIINNIFIQNWSNVSGGVNGSGEHLSLEQDITGLEGSNELLNII